MTILITGVAGLLGSRLADYLCDLNYKVIGIDDMSGGYVENIDSRVLLYQKNIAQDDIGYIFQEHKPDYVFHLPHMQQKD